MELTEDQKKKLYLIGEPYRNKNGELIRRVDGVEIGQIEEKTQNDKDINLIINLWRLRNKK